LHIITNILGTKESSSYSFALAQEAAAPETIVQVESSTFVPPENAEHYKFEAEVSRMLDIVVNSLYQNKDVFLRELISNASDALDKIRFMSLTMPELLEGEEKLQVQIEYDPEHRTLTVRDTGIGMTHNELVENLGTVARSGTTKFMQALKEKGGDATKSGDISQIGQFGVGFYSAFLVADRVQVASKHRDSPEQLVWVSTNGASEFQIYPDPRGTTMVRGTEITLFLKEDAVEYVDPNRLEGLTKHYSEFIMHPIHLRTIKTVEVEIEEEEEEKKEDEENLEVNEDDDDAEEKEKQKRTQEVTTFEWSVMNGNPAIWTRPKEEITDDEYKAFFKVVSHEDYADVASWSHFNAEGNINFKSILYLPSDIPESYKFGNTLDSALGLNLYVRKVLISDQFELLPRYLSFIRGVVDSDDLPLNVNRETLQDSKIIQVIKKKAVRKAIEMIRNFMKTSDDEVAKEKEPQLDEDGNEIPDLDTDTKVVNKYLKWYESFSPSLKMGAMEDEPNRAKLLKLLRYKTSKSGDEWVSLEQYVENMKDWQKEIYYMAGINMDAVKSSPFLEQFLAKGVEVIYSTDPVDEYMIGHVRDFSGKKFINIASESVKFKDEDDKDLVTRREKYYKDKFKPLIKWLKKLYGTNVMRVVISKRLGSAPAIASSSEYGHSANMERIMRAQAFNHGQQEFSLKAMRIFEINPRHPLVVKLQEGCPPEDADDSFVVAEEVIDAAWLLHEMALLGGGFPLSDPEGHAKRIIKFIQSSLNVESLQLEPELDLPALDEVAPEVEGAGPKGSSMEDAIPLDLDDLDLGNFEL
jgi:heat shock protein 90kDa beta